MPRAPAKRYVRKRAPTSRRAPTRVRRRAAPRSSYLGSAARAVGRGISSVAKGAYGVGKFATKAALGAGLGYLGRNTAANLLGMGHGSAAEGLLDAYNYIMGSGAYKMTRNSLMDQTAQSVPFMHSSKDGVRVRHREFLADVSSSTTFVNTTYSVNPGLADTFPWLAALAQNFEEYRFEGLAFEFVSTSADALNSTNTALGTVILAAEYNVLAPAFINKQQMENNMWAVSSKPSSCQVMPIECSPALNPLANQYIRIGAIPTGSDQRMYDLCNFQIATVGSQAVAVIGELWVTYDIVLLKPQLSSGLNLAGQSTHLHLQSASGTNPLGTSQTVAYDSIGGVISGSGTVYTFPLGSQGNYRVGITAVGTSASLVAPSFAATNCTEVKIFEDDTKSYENNGGTTGTVFMWNFVINIPDPTTQAYFTLGTGGTYPTSTTHGDFFIDQVSGNLNS